MNNWIHTTFFAEIGNKIRLRILIHFKLFITTLLNFRLSKKVKAKFEETTLNSGISRIFQTWGGGGTLAYYFANFSWKMSENKEILVVGDVLVPPSLDPSLLMC